jgi:hypothetical protein
MSSPDKGAGPQITQDVLYNNGGTITAATIYAANPANETVSLVWFGAGGATSATGVGYDRTFEQGSWPIRRSNEATAAI